MNGELFAAPPVRPGAVYVPGPVIRAVPLRAKAAPLQVPMMNRKHWYKLATMEITDYSASDQYGQCFVEMKCERGPIRIATPVTVAWLDREFAKAMFCPVLFRDETDMEALGG